MGRVGSKSWIEQHEVVSRSASGIIAVFAPVWFPDSSKPVKQRLAEQFMFVYNKWKKDGEPPDAGGKSDDEPNQIGSAEAVDEDLNDQAAEQADAADRPSASR